MGCFDSLRSTGLGLLTVGGRASNWGGICAGELGLSKGVGAGKSRCRVSDGRTCLNVLFYRCPSPGVICRVECEVVLGAARVSLMAFFPESWAISVVAWVQAWAINALIGLSLCRTGFRVMHFCTFAASGVFGSAVTTLMSKSLAFETSDRLLLRFLWAGSFAKDVRTFSEDFVRRHRVSVVDPHCCYPLVLLPLVHRFDPFRLQNRFWF